MPTLLKISSFCISAYSGLSTLDTVFFAPKRLARMQLMILCASSGITLMNRSAFFISALLSVASEVGDAQSVSKSKLAPMLSNFSSSSSMRVMSWCSFVKSLAKCRPIAPAPTIMIFIFRERYSHWRVPLRPARFAFTLMLSAFGERRIGEELFSCLLNAVFIQAYEMI